MALTPCRWGAARNHGSRTGYAGYALGHPEACVGRILYCSSNYWCLFCIFRCFVGHFWYGIASFLYFVSRFLDSLCHFWYFVGHFLCGYGHFLCGAGRFLVLSGRWDTGYHSRNTG